MSKGRNIAAWVVVILASIAPGWGVIGKFIDETMMTHMTNLGFGDWLSVIAIGELVAVVTYIIPKTTKIGLLLMTALMGGAIAVHLGAGETFGMQSTVLVLVWLGAYLRDPNLFKTA